MMASENIGLIVEGVIHLLMVIIIGATLYRRGKNPYLMVLGFFFGLFGLLSLVVGLFFDLALQIKTISSFHLIGQLTHQITFTDFFVHYVAYFGVVGYLVFQLAMIYGQKILRRSFFGLSLAAIILALIHSYHLPIFNLSAENKIFFSALAQRLDAGFFILALSVMVVILAFLLRQLRKIKNQVPLNYVATTCTGTTIIVAALLSLKLLHPLVGDPLVDLTVFLTYGLVLAGFIVQFSLISLPGIVYNYETRLPVPLAIVRIIDKNKNRIIESKVTGVNGRYEVFLDVGNYALTVLAQGYEFPSGKKMGYQGEEIKIKRPTLLSLDIPLEPIKN